MTNEEAIQVLHHIVQVADTSDCGIKEIDGLDEEALDMAIKVLEQKPCEDIAQERYKDLCEYFGNAKDILKSREDFKAWLGRVKWHIRKAEELYEKYEYKQEPKTGHWVEENINEWSRKVFCSKCGCPSPFEHISNGDVYSASGYGVSNKTKYCPNCGAKMESEDKYGRYRVGD